MSKVQGIIPWEDAIKRVYPFNLIYAVFLPDDPELYWRLNIPAFLNGLATLTDREQKVLCLRFERGLTYEQAGKHFGVTRERIRQVEAKALRKMRHPSRSNKFTMIDGGEVQRIQMENEYLRAENEALRTHIAFAVHTLRDRRIPVEMYRPRKNPEPERKPELTVPDHDLSIDELNLSVRSWNCCRRAGYSKVGDFVGKTTADLMMTRNLGRKSMEELIAKLAEHGVEIERV